MRTNKSRLFAVVTLLVMALMFTLPMCTLAEPATEATTEVQVEAIAETQETEVVAEEAIAEEAPAEA